MRSNKLWEILLPFSDYAFNKAHSAAYGVISYWTAYLKAHYPAEYMAALLTSVGDSKDKMALYLNECRRMGIKVLPPDVNESILFFAAVGSDIRFGLGRRAQRRHQRGRGRSARPARRRAGSSRSTTSCRKVPIHAANKRTVESLIKAGAFDSLGHTRRALVEVHEDAVESAVKIKRNEANGDVGFDFDSLWGDDEQTASQHHIPDRPEWAKRDKLAFEREMLGLYVSDHPLAGLELPLAKLASTSIAELVGSESVQDGETVTIAGLVTSVQHRVAKASGNQYGMIQVEDFGGELTVMFMGKAYQEFSHLLQGDAIVVVRGRVSLRDDGMNLHAFSLMTPDLGQSVGSGPLMITMPDQRATTDTVDDAPRRARASPRRQRGAAAAGQGSGRAGVRGAEAGDRQRGPVRGAEGPARPELPGLMRRASGLRRCGRGSGSGARGTAAPRRPRRVRPPRSARRRRRCCARGSARRCGRPSTPVTSLMTGRPCGPRNQWSPSNRSALSAASFSATARLRTPSMWITTRSVSEIAGQLDADRAMLNVASGGTAASDASDVAVKPTGVPSDVCAVMMATPAACRRKA